MTSTKKKRLDSIQKSMDQTSAVTHYVTKRVDEFPSMADYARAVRDGRPTRYDVIKSVMASAKSKMRREKITGEELARKANKVGAEALFLIRLADGANKALYADASEAALHSSVLALQMKDILEADAFGNQARSALWHLEKTAYPLSPDMADAVRLNWKARPISDGYLRDLVDDAVRLHFIDKGARLIPRATYMTEVELLSSPSSEDEAIDEDRPDIMAEFTPEATEVLKIFDGDRDSYKAFRKGDDFRHGLAGVTDSDFEALSGAIMAKIEALAEGGELEKGKAFCHGGPVLSHAFDLVTLVESEWIDELAVELTEAAAILTAEGFEDLVFLDHHDLAWFVPKKGEDEVASIEDIDAAREAARSNMASFKGDKKTIEGRRFWRFHDYLDWPGKASTSDLTGQWEGVLYGSLSAWLDDHSDEAIADYPIADLKKRLLPRRPLFVEIDDADELRRLLMDRYLMVAKLNQWIIPKTELEGEQYIRNRMNVFNQLERAGLGIFADRQHKTRISDWRDRAMNFAAVAYQIQEAIRVIEKKYFGGQSILFDDAKERMTNQVETIENIIGAFNKTVAYRLDRFEGRQLLTGERPSKAKRDEGFAIDLNFVNHRAFLAVDRKVKELAEAAKIEALTEFDFYDEAEARLKRIPM
jgi:cell fate (sporulation/competence/biofilm development) regulator YmcA (YheA/YmcA/DUF963 family)